MCHYLFRKKDLILITSILIWATIFAINARANPNLKNAIDRLVEKSKKQNEVRIILQPNISKATLIKLEDRLNLRQRRVRLLNKLNLGVYTLDTATLQKLIDSKLASHIYEDALSAPSLHEALPRINALLPHSNQFKGANKVVAILDTGFDKKHPFIEGKIIQQACFSTTNNMATSLCPSGSNREISDNAASECLSQTGIDNCNHGTHIAGIIAGSGDSTSGVAPEASIVAIQVFSLFTPEYCDNAIGCLLSYESDQLAGLEWLLYQSNIKNIAVVNMSFGAKRAYYTCDGDRRKYIIDNLLTNNIITVVAAGNDGYTNAINSPACVSSAVSVSSSNDTSDSIPKNSNRAPFLDFFAPGTRIYSSSVGGGYKEYGGSSAAAALVSGAFLVLSEQHPDLSMTEIKTLLKTNAMPLYDSDTDTFYPRLTFSDHPITICNWYGSYTPICHIDNGGWGWENNYSCISASQCSTTVTTGIATTSAALSQLSTTKLPVTESATTQSPTTQSAAKSNSAGKCNWYGRIYNICITPNTLDWGWENNGSCITQALCDSQPQSHEPDL